MQAFTFDNQMKATGVTFIKTGAVFSAIIFAVSLLLTVFNILDIITALIIGVLFFLLFWLIGSFFIIQQKTLTFTNDTVDIHAMAKKLDYSLPLDTIESVTIIFGGNYQPKIIIKSSDAHQTITCANTVYKKDLMQVKAYFEAKHILTTVKDKSIQ